MSKSGGGGGGGAVAPPCPPSPAPCTERVVLHDRCIMSLYIIIVGKMHGV